MIMTGEEFLAQPRKRITLIGMSGVGKSYTSHALENMGWTNYSCDYLIGTKYLDDVMQETLSFETTVGKDNMAFLSKFVGMLGSPDKGGLSMEEFRRRQQLYYEAECDSLRDMRAAVEAAEGHFVCDSSGSFCEIDDESILHEVGEQSLIVYLKVRQEGHAEILDRAFKSPKPLYFPPSFLTERLQRYFEKFDLVDFDEIDPLEFLRWVFPSLFESRLPKYKKLAQRYGVVVPSHEMVFETEDEFFQIIAKALDARQEQAA